MVADRKPAVHLAAGIAVRPVGEKKGHDDMVVVRCVLVVCVVVLFVAAKGSIINIAEESQPPSAPLHTHN